MEHATSPSKQPFGGRKWTSTRNASPSEAQPETSYRGSRFSEVWRAVAADPYDSLPDKRLTWASVRTLIERNIYRASRRTLTSRHDLLAPFDKLVHPVGICLRGTWTIEETTPYTGLFKTGARGLIIARASDAMGEHRPGKLRFLGLAGKLYPTLDPEHAQPLATANFFTMENLAGSHSTHFVQTKQRNDLFPVVPQPGVVAKAPMGLVVGTAFMLADRALRVRQAMIRELYPIAELGELDRDDSVCPAVLQLEGASTNRRVETSDLRHELDMQYHPDGIRFDISVADRRSLVVPSGFKRIGQIHFTESVASYSGDHRLHFAHPPYRGGR